MTQQPIKPNATEETSSRAGETILRAMALGIGAGICAYYGLAMSVGSSTGFSRPGTFLAFALGWALLGYALFGGASRPR